MPVPTKEKLTERVQSAMRDRSPVCQFAEVVSRQSRAPLATGNDSELVSPGNVLRVLAWIEAAGFRVVDGGGRAAYAGSVIECPQ
jgi:hypothetical protein